MDNTWIEGGIKKDTGKPAMSLLDRYALEEIASVLRFGATKYHAHNWRGGIRFTRLTDATLRHMFAFIDGENTDPETNISHIAHASCCLMFLLWMVKHRPDLDDRYKGEQSLSKIEQDIREVMMSPEMEAIVTAAQSHD
jgi:hypothetical protein